VPLLESRSAIDIRLLVVTALAGVAIVASLTGGYLFGARKSASEVTAAVGKESAVAASEKSRAALEDADHARPSRGVRMLPTVPSATNLASAAPQEPPALSPEEGRRRHIARLTTSGPDTRGLLADARRVGEDWESALIAKGLAVTFGDWHCFRAGCFVEAKHASADAIEEASSVVTSSSGFTSWNGEKIRTGPVALPDGKTDVVWILLPPPEGEASLPPDLNHGATANGPPNSR
jgi:hypothetical protein